MKKQEIDHILTRMLDSHEQRVRSERHRGKAASRWKAPVNWCRLSSIRI
jgi:hypothetical protein